ncbi:choloylglycine hydrolase [uncultured Limosilactobacillus sp.]|uniref:choloylglycine hydrolase n=1 Tax=uncultured Limosilactobacillus sp. TaxID=2837629 RepID=UPI0025EAE4EC|nr:choloylglycine hydrolase [uncultured Limosilactobacillus sp.]
MCTSIIYSAGDGYFGRNLDLEMTLGQKVVIMPRHYPLRLKNLPTITDHFAITGMAIIRDHYPLYFDGANEKGLGMAGLNFNGPAHFFGLAEHKDNVASFEIVPYLLAQAATVAEAKQLLTTINLTNQSFSATMTSSPLHWLVADKSGAAIVVESTRTGLHVYDDPVGVLTNNPEFPQQMTNLANYRNVSVGEPVNTLAPGIDIPSYSRGIGSSQLPGGLDSESRFVREVFTKAHAPLGTTEDECVSHFFHCLNNVAQPQNLDEVAPNKFEYTIYTDCLNLATGTLYYTTYTNQQINAVALSNIDLNTSELSSFELVTKQAINYQN